MSYAVPLPMVSDRRSFVVIIGVDPHKRTHTASALEPDSHRVLATLQIDANLAGYRQLARWAARFEVRRWAVENARGLGRHLAQWLAARGEQVDDVLCTATARVRELSRGGRRKNDVIDAAATSVAALAGDATAGRAGRAIDQLQLPPSTVKISSDTVHDTNCGRLARSASTHVTAARTGVAGETRCQQ
jgi:hypothetical protein